MNRYHFMSRCEFYNEWVKPDHSYEEPVMDFKKGDKVLIILPYVEDGKQIFCCKELSVKYIIDPIKTEKYAVLSSVKEINPISYSVFREPDEETGYYDILFNTNVVKNEDVILLCAPFLVTDEDAENYMNLVNKWNKYGVSKTDKLFAVVTDLERISCDNNFLARFSLAK